MALTFARGSRAVPRATAYDAVHGAFMTLPPYTRIREGEVHSPSLGVRNGSHRARSRPVSATRESSQRACPATSAKDHDYPSNLRRYPEWHAYFRRHQPPTVVVWGKNDPLLG